MKCSQCGSPHVKVENVIDDERFMDKLFQTHCENCGHDSCVEGGKVNE